MSLCIERKRTDTLKCWPVGPEQTRVAESEARVRQAGLGTGWKVGGSHTHPRSATRPHHAWRSSRKHGRLGPSKRNASSDACGHLSHHGPELEATQTLSTRRVPRLGRGRTRQSRPREGTASWHADGVGGSQRRPDERETRDTHTHTVRAPVRFGAVVPDPPGTGGLLGTCLTRGRSAGV